MEYLTCGLVGATAGYIIYELRKLIGEFGAFKTYLQEISGVTPSEIRLAQQEADFDQRIEDMRLELLSAAARAEERYSGANVADERAGVKNLPHYEVDIVSDKEEVAI